MSKPIRELVSLLLVPILFATLYESYAFIGSHPNLDALRWFAVGVLGYVILYGAMGSRIKFIEIFEHELDHMLMAWVFFQRVQTFVVTTDPRLNGGLVGYEGSSNFLIALAPYFLPVFSLPFIVLKLYFPASYILDIAIGATLAFHYLGLLKEFRSYQLDITRTGLIFSFVIVGVINAVILVLIFCTIQDDFSGLQDYFANLYDLSLATYRWLAQQLRQA